MLKRVLPALLIAALSMTTAATHVWAKPATCYTDDEGRYPCDFEQFGGDGSFTISARGVPHYTISIEGRGVASGFADYGNGRNVPLPGPFYRSRQDRACWVSDATGFRICAY